MTEDTITIAHDAQNTGSPAPWTMEEMVNDTLALKELLQIETAALKKMDIKTVQALHEDKLRLIRKLELQKELLVRDPDMLQGVNDVQKSRLKSASDGMDTVMKANFCEVLKAREVNQCVVRAISKEVRKHEQSASGYNRYGQHPTKSQANVSGDGGPAIALNQMI